MLSPSLISIIFHSLGPELLSVPVSPPGSPINPLIYRDTSQIASSFKNAVANTPVGRWPLIPVFGRTKSGLGGILEWLPDVAFAEDDRGLHFWGRVPLNALVDFFVVRSSLHAAEEYVDVGTPIYEAGSGLIHDADCASMLPGTAGSAGTAKVGVAVIDTGKLSSFGPDTYDGMLRQAVMGGIEMSDHAEKVLAVLLDRLKGKGGTLLGDTTVSCALIRPAPTPPHPGTTIGIGLTCFEQDNVVEMLDAVKALDAHLASESTPTAINMSLGTHVGPHNGESPLEGFIAETLTSSNRFLIAAVGNEGGTGRAAKRRLIADEEDTVSLHTGVDCKELLIEFWWDDRSVTDLSVLADVYETMPGGRRVNHCTLLIDEDCAGAALATVPGSSGGLLMHSLFSAKCYGGFSCIAFALTAAARKQLPLLQVRFALTSKRDTIVNAWIVIAEPNPLTAFVEGGQGGNAMVPASSAAVLSVAALGHKGEMWKGSARGPAAQYDLVEPRTGCPLMAHLGYYRDEIGTSFASPRACGDAAEALARPHWTPTNADPQNLLTQMYPLAPRWSPRYGYRMQKS